MRKDAIISMRNVATVLLACAIVLLCFAWRSPAYASGLGSIELSCGAERAGEHVALAGDGYALTKVASAEVDGASASVAYATEEAFSGVDRNWVALDGAGLVRRRMRCLPMPKSMESSRRRRRMPMRRARRCFLRSSPACTLSAASRLFPLTPSFPAILRW